MKRTVLQTKSLVVLQLLLGPILALYISRYRAKADARREAVLYRPPGPEAFKTLEFFSKWPDSLLKEWVQHGVLVTRKKGTCVGFAREPPRAAHVHWILAGKITQVPTKRELRECASELPQLPPNVPKSGPALLPFVFSEDSGKAALSILTPTQERILDSLAIYHAGRLVDAESLLLGGGRQRSLRCQTDVVLLSFPFSLLLKKMEDLATPLRKYTIDVARSVVQQGMAQLVELPPLRFFTVVNPVLKGLSHSTLRALRLQLKPFVFLQSEVICSDVANSDTVFFLIRGKVLIEDTERCLSRVAEKRLTAVGLETFVPYRMPDHCDQKLRAKSLTYCEMWGIPTGALLALCGAETRLRCAQTATQLLGNDVSRLALTPALRTCPCFASISDISLTLIARALRARVYCAGDTILVPRRSPSAGLLVVTGVVFAESVKKASSQRLYPGQAYYFCESFVKMEVAESVVSRSSSVVLHGSPGRIFEFMEGSPSASDMDIMLEGAQKYVDLQYGSGASDLSKAQSAAVERVKAYRRRHGESATAECPHGSGGDLADALAAMKNELLVSLSLQLQALQPDTMADLHFSAFQAERPAMTDEDPSSYPRPSAEYFSLDEEGRFVTCASPAPVVPTHFLTEFPVAFSAGASSLTTDVAATSILQPNRKQERGASTRVSVPVAPRSLRTEVHAPVPITAAQRREPQPRLSALRTTATRLREEADGIDWKKEYRRHLMRVKHFP